MKPTTLFLDPTRKILDQVVDYLCAPEQVRQTPVGVPSLAHILLVVGTAQASRRIRCALAKRLGGVIPPRIQMPAQLVQPTDTTTLANRTDCLFALWEACEQKVSLDGVAQFAELRDTLGTAALTFQDVASRLPEILTGELADVELERWRTQLVPLEERYLRALARRGKKDPILARQEVLAHPVAPEGITSIVLACVLDPFPAAKNYWERCDLPVVELVPMPSTSSYLPLERFQIIPCATVTEEAHVVASRLASVQKDEALPALCVADAELFLDVQTVAQVRGVTIHNPSQMCVASSPLGRLALQVASLMSDPSFAIFSSFIRSGDVRRALRAHLQLSQDDFACALTELDALAATHLPELRTQIMPEPKGVLARIMQKVKQWIASKDVRLVLRELFASVRLEEASRDAREFASVAQKINVLIDECLNETIDSKIRMELFARRLQESTYSLEPDAVDAVQTDGWLELLFVDADELILSGFQEGVVPESLVGHPFLPDSLRQALGLASNASRGARDQELLRLVLSCRKPDAVQISFHMQNAKGEQLKPSRLLFLCEDPDDFRARVHAFYAGGSSHKTLTSADLPEAWRIQLPIPPETQECTTISPTKLDNYLKCPFSYYLKETFGDEIETHVHELKAADFGSKVHCALENWGKSSYKDSEDRSEIADFLAQEIDRLFEAQFGAAIPTIVALQANSMKKRLALFAQKQVEWRQKGWRIKAVESPLHVTYGHTTIKGRVDRIDFNEQTHHWCVIDYKTWRNQDKAKFIKKNPKTKEESIVSLQLPLYVAMLDADHDSSHMWASDTREKMCACYCVLAEDPTKLGFSEIADVSSLSKAEELVRALIVDLERGIYWPPKEKFGRHARSVYGHEWIFNSPNDSFSEAWIQDQEARLKKYHPQDASDETHENLENPLA